MLYYVLIILAILYVVYIIASSIDDHKYKNNYPKITLTKQQQKIIEKDIKNMNGRQFEEFIAFLFRENNDKVILTPPTRDGGKDLIINYDTYVELKRYTDGTIGRPMIQKLLGACISDNIKNALFITTSSYTTDAIQLLNNCKNINIKYWYLDDVLDFCNKVGMYKVLEYLGYKNGEIEILSMVK